LQAPLEQHRGLGGQLARLEPQQLEWRIEARFLEFSYDAATVSLLHRPARPWKSLATRSRALSSLPHSMSLSRSSRAKTRVSSARETEKASAICSYRQPLSTSQNTEIRRSSLASAVS